jgi:hypothetical protein
MNLEIERCRGEIAAIEAELLAGNPDIEGLCLALGDWSAELRLLLDEGVRRRNDEVIQAPGEARSDRGSKITLGR